MTLSKKGLAYWLLISVQLCYGLAYADQRYPSDQPLTINSQQAEFNERSGYALYSGGVFIEHGPVSIEAEDVTIFTDEKGRRKAIATGMPAQVLQLGSTIDSSMSAKALTVTYLISDKLLLLDESAHLKKQGKTFTGSAIRYDLKNRKVMATGSQNEQVKLIIPAEQLTSDKGTAQNE